MTVHLKTVNLKIIGTRLGIGLSAAVGVAVKEPDLLRTLSGRLTLAAVFFLSATPWAPGSAGVLRPVTPGQLSLAEKIGNALTTLINTPAAKRQQKAKDMAVQGFQEAWADPKTRAMLTLELQRAQLWQPGQPVPEEVQAKATMQAATPASPVSETTLAAQPLKAEAETGKVEADKVKADEVEADSDEVQ